ncbi:TetR/AcrR family transcriptional regulator [Amycolatopsis sp. CA-128772]|uniref:TetR/AcrR family transcriptional regulator n=1 Tax=Amycolatopsis sp. CA-128772 TaxID=2073159 RepID=UPI000CD236C6|nr:TetR family transcriptional regulator [Amycolatopsis sp. CA-128772]
MARPEADAKGAGRRPRRHDPGRRVRILDAALDVLVERGPAGMTHRHVAARADVPLGSVTYHFAGLAELQAQAFTRFVELQTAVFETLFDAVATRADFVEVLADLVHASPARQRSAVLGFELHLAALRDPELRVLAEAWTRSSQAVLARFVGADDAARLDALLEGMIMHALLATGPGSREAARSAIEKAVELPGADGFPAA